VYKRDYAFSMNVMEEIFEIRNSRRMISKSIHLKSTCSTVNGELHPLGGKNVLDTYDQF